MPRLYVKDLDGEQVFDMLEENLSIGRTSENDLLVKDPALSRHHCRIVLEQSAFWLEDLESKNGTRINGDSIRRQQLKAQDVIQLGKAEIRFEWLPGEEDKYALESEDNDTDTPTEMELRVVSTEAAPAEEDSVQLSADAPVRFQLLPLSDGQDAVPFDLLHDTVTLGRGNDRDFLIKDPAASSDHARLVRDGETYRLIDSGSRNGIYVDGVQVKECLLEPGATLRIGKTQLQFLDLEAEDQLEEDSPSGAIADADTTARLHHPESSVHTTWAPDVDIDQIPVRSGDTRVIDRSKRTGAEEEPDTETATFGSSESSVREGKGGNGTAQAPATGTDSGTGTGRKRAPAAEEVSSVDAGPITSLFGSMARDTGTEAVAEEEMVEEERKRPARPSSAPASKKATAHGASRRPSSARARRGRASNQDKESVVVGWIIGSLLSIGIIGFGVWYAFPPEMNPFSSSSARSGPKKIIRRIVKKKKPVQNPETEEMVEVEVPSISRDQLFKSQKPAIKSPASSGTQGGMITLTAPKVGQVGEEEEAPMNLDDFIKQNSTKAPETIKTARSLNATRRAENYDFLTDLATELAEAANEEQAELSEADRRQLAAAREMMAEFKLKKASEALQKLEQPRNEAAAVATQLKWMAEALTRIDSFLTSEDSDLSLKDVVPKSSMAGRLDGANSRGLWIETDGARKIILWNALTHSEQFRLAQKCIQDSSGESHVTLGVLALNLHLRRQARKEFALAEKKGYENISEFKKLLERVPDKLN